MSAPALFASRLLPVLVIVITAACSREPARPAGPPARIILVTIDTWRADAIGASGSGKVATPVLDRFATGGLYAAKAWSSATLTAPSHATILTGLQPYGHGVRNNHGYRIDAGATTLASALRHAGYATAAFVSAHPVARHGGFDVGFDVFNDQLGGGDPLSVVPRSRPGAETIAAATAWIHGAPERFFLWVHLYEPHDPYDPPPPYRDRYRDAPYYGEVAYADELVGRLRDALGARGEHDALWVICGDHGESLGEHGEATHGLFVYDATARVPLIVWSPGRVAPSHLDTARLVDVMPTVLSLSGQPVPPGLDGRLLLGSDASKSAPQAYVETMYAYLDFGAAPVRAGSDGRLKLIDVPQREVYDLIADPAENHNLAGASGVDARVDPLAAQLNEHPHDPEPPAPDHDLASAAALRSLGYIGAGGQYRLGTTGMDPKEFVPLHRTLDEAHAFALAHNWPEAASRFATLLEAFPRSSLLAQEYGMIRLAEGNPAEAEPLLLRAVSLDPLNVHAWLGLANVAIARGDTASAEKRLLAVVAIDPDDVEANFDLGALYQQNLGRPADAARYWGRFLELRPDDSEAPRIRELIKK